MGRWWIVLCLLCTACADSHLVSRVESSETVRLTSGNRFYVAVPKDGMYGRKTYAGSGLMTAQIVSSSLQRRVRSVVVAPAHQSFDMALKRAGAGNSDYLVYPTILEWEDRATEWSALPDRVAVKIEIIRVDTGESVDSVVISGKSGLATLGGDHPQDLLPRPIEEYFATFFEKR